MTGLLRQLTLILLTGLMLYTNLWSGSGGGFSDDATGPSVYFLYPTSFTPAPFTFAIWLPIFAGAVGLAVYQALPRHRRNSKLDRIAVPYCVALCANAATPYTNLGLSNLVVLILVMALAIAFGRTLPLTKDPWFRWFVQAPLAVFATWAGLATILNACQWVVSQGGSVGPASAAALVALAMTGGMIAIVRTKEPLIAVVMVWAGIGIAAAHASAAVLVLAVVATSIMTLCTALWIRRRIG